jgi:S-formylglutathione hydrolase
MAATAVQPGGIAAQGKQWHGGVTRVDTVAAPALRANLIGDPHRREATVNLPPGYSRNRSKRYPVIYLLHGFAADHRVFIRGPYGNMNVRISMDSLIEKGAIGEMIVVTPNARNFFDGSFYMNSPVTGNWENFVVHDLVGHVDRKYRTIRSRNSRGIAGHSMGGYGALRIAMRHPDIFSAV